MAFTGTGCGTSPANEAPSQYTRKTAFHEAKRGFSRREGERMPRKNPFAWREEEKEGRTDGWREGGQEGEREGESEWERVYLSDGGREAHDSCTTGI